MLKLKPATTVADSDNTSSSQETAPPKLTGKKPLTQRGRASAAIRETIGAAEKSKNKEGEEVSRYDYRSPPLGLSITASQPAQTPHTRCLLAIMPSHQEPEPKKNRPPQMEDISSKSGERMRTAAALFVKPKEAEDKIEGFGANLENGPLNSRKLQTGPSSCKKLQTGPQK